MITESQVSELSNGDVIELFDHNGTTVRGTLRRFGSVDSHGLSLGSSGLVVRRVDGCLAGQWTGWSLTVVSRALRPLYVNHPRTEPIAGDVVRVEFKGYEDDWCLNAYTPVEGSDKPWLSIAREDAGTRYEAAMVIPAPDTVGYMRLLVDGETGQVVP